MTKGARRPGPDGDEDEEYEKKVMTIARGELCIGCTACARICPKKCYTTPRWRCDMACAAPPR